MVSFKFLFHAAYSQHMNWKLKQIVKRSPISISSNQYNLKKNYLACNAILSTVSQYFCAI
jgi:hypothetical protein